MERAPRKQQALAIANGDFTPLRQSTWISIPWWRMTESASICKPVCPGSTRTVHVVAGGNEKKKKARVTSKVEEIHQQVLNQEEAAIKNLTSPGKVQRLKAAFLARLPYRRPSLPVGTNFTAELKVPLNFGTRKPLHLNGWS